MHVVCVCGGGGGGDKIAQTLALVWLELKRWPEVVWMPHYKKPLMKVQGVVSRNACFGVVFSDLTWTLTLSTRAS